jgi:hypothetical protein
MSILVQLNVNGAKRCVIVGKGHGVAQAGFKTFIAPDHVEQLS